MARFFHPWPLNLREWQNEAYQKVIQYQNRGKKDFLDVSTPGSGKTIFALRIAHKALYEREANRIVVVVPTEGLKGQWAEEASKVGINLDPTISNKKGRENTDFHGSVLTYAQLGVNSSHHRIAINQSKTFVIFDEIHHAGSDLTWGDALISTFENAIFRLSLSGTPFRSDSAKIPFVSYTKDETTGLEMSKADYTYSYTRAISEGVCRPLFFHTYDGEMKWKYGKENYKFRMSDNITREDLISQRLRAALDSTKGDFLKTIITEADEKLDKIRNYGGHPDAGGLLVAIDQTQARKIAKLVYDITGEVPTTVISEMSDANKKIDKFRKSDAKWLVSVKMVSEGVDIKRLRVGVYATVVKQEMFFRQFSGRFVRTLNELADQDAHIYMPKDVNLVWLAKKIEEEREHAIGLKSTFEEFEKRSAREGDQFTLFEALGATVIGKEKFGPNMKKKKGQIQEPITKSLFQEKIDLRDEINKLIRLLAFRRKQPFKDIHIEYMRETGGKRIEYETTDELRRRLAWVEQRL